MKSYSLGETVNKITGGICESYISSGFVRNPIIAGMIVTIITLLIVNYTKNKDTTKIFILATLANVAYLFFHTHALSSYIKNKGVNSNLVTEFNGIIAEEDIGEVEIYKPKEC